MPCIIFIVLVATLGILFGRCVVVPRRRACVIGRFGGFHKAVHAGAVVGLEGWAVMDGDAIKAGGMTALATSDDGTPIIPATFDVIGSHAGDIPDLTFPAIAGPVPAGGDDGADERALATRKAAHILDVASGAVRVPDAVADTKVPTMADPDIDADLMERVSHVLDDYDEGLPPDERRRLDHAALMNAHRFDIVIVLVGAVLIGLGLALMFG